MKRAFTLLELLVVMAIMGIMGTAAVGGYRQLQRGMAERGVMDNANQFIRSAYQRAQIDRTPVEVYFWNETLKSRSEDANEVVVGRAVAVRRRGRISALSSLEGKQLLIDEFGDLEQFDYDQNSNIEYAENPNNDSEARLYQMEGNDQMSYSVIFATPRTRDTHGYATERFVTHSPVTGNTSSQSPNSSQENVGSIIQYGYCVKSQGNAKSWQIGSAYGFEFQQIELPHGFIFGSQYSTNARDPIQGERKVVYKPDSSSAQTVDVYALRPGQDGMLSAQKVSSTDNPAQSLK